MASLAARVAKAAGRGLFRTQQEGQLSRAANQGSRQTRNFASDHGHHEGVSYQGLTLHKPATWHVVVGKGLAATMWFWVLYRFYHDFDHFVYGPAAHMEHELHEEEHHSEEGGQGHGHH
ncbi:hypothetical protein N2152v2_010059 [Parachlorella kessleri]